MSLIFISHASSDVLAACAVASWLSDNGWDDIFLDVDPQQGLIAGTRWQEELSAAAHRCEAVIVLISKSWNQSKWCLAEFLLAKSLGKKILGIEIDCVDIAELPTELVSHYQITKLSNAGPTIAVAFSDPFTRASNELHFSKSGLDRLRDGLERAGLNPSSFKLDTSRPIYPGLRALDVQDAAILFGRDADIVRGMDAIRRMRDSGKRILVILGASGAGKSSFLRAGLMPRLQRSFNDFATLPILRTENGTLGGESGLVEILSRYEIECGREANGRAYWRSIVSKEGLSSALKCLRQHRPHVSGVGSTAHRRDPLYVLAIDQAEELFQDKSSTNTESFLRAISQPVRSGELLTIFCIRSDSYAHLQAAKSLEGIEQEIYSLPPMARGAIKDVIEGPARRDREERGADGLTIDPLLTERLMHDWPGEDALPLLAFTLRNLVDEYGCHGTLDLSSYEASGGLSGSLGAAIKKALTFDAATESLSIDNAEQERLLRRAFIPWLIAIDSHTRLAIRLQAKRENIPSEAGDLIDRLIEARLLISHRSLVGNVVTTFVEIAHESLLRQWPLLSAIIDQERAILAMANEVKRSAATWAENGRSDDLLLHRGVRLDSAIKMLTRDDFRDFLGVDARDYVDASRKREQDAQRKKQEEIEREESHRLRNLANQRKLAALLIAFSAVLIVGTALMFASWRKLNQSRSNALMGLSNLAYREGNFASAVRYGIASLEGSDSFLFGFDAHNAEAQLRRSMGMSRQKFSLPHDSSINMATLNKQGTLAATASYDYYAKVWDLTDGRELRRFRHDRMVNTVVFSNDGRRLLTASGDETARLWDVETGQQLLMLKHDSIVVNAMFSPDESRIITASYDGSARVWNAHSGKEMQRFQHPWPIYNASFSANAALIITASSDHNARIWNAETGELLHTLPHSSPVSDAVFSPDGSLAVTTASEPNARVWNVASGRLLKELPHEIGVFAASFDRSGRRLVTASLDHSAHVWNTSTWQEMLRAQSSDAVVSASFSADGERLISASRDHTARVWDLASGGQLMTLAHDNQVVSATFDESGSIAITSSSDGYAKVWDVSDRRLLKQHSFGDPPHIIKFGNSGKNMYVATQQAAHLFRANADSRLDFIEGASVSDMDVSQDETMIALSTYRDYVSLWRTSSDSSPLKLLHEDSVLSGRFNYEGSEIATASSDKTVRVWSTKDGAQKLSLPHPDEVVSARFSRDGSLILSACEDGSAYLWDRLTGKLLRTLRHSRAPYDSKRAVSVAEFGGDEGIVLTASSDGIARVWRLSNGSIISEFHHAGAVISASLTYADELVVSYSEGPIAFVWNARTGREIARLRHDAPISSAAISNNGKRALTSSVDGSVKLWDLQSGRELANYDHDKWILGVAFSRDDKRAYTASHDRFVREWNADVVHLASGADLIDVACTETLSVSVDSTPLPNEQAWLSVTELQQAAIAGPKNVCREGF